VGFFKIFYPLFFGSKVFDEYFGCFGIIPKIWSKGFLLFIDDFYLLGIDVKDTSSTHQDALQYL
jgi:hypothetical protein